MLAQIENRLPSLSRAERRVGQWLLAHPRQAAGATLAEVAGACGTSEPTVIRFCRKLGLGGFRELTIRLTEALSRPAGYVHRDVLADDKAVDAAIKVLDASIQSLIEVRAELSGIPIERAVAILAEARQVAFAGLGASGYVARDASHKFFRLGIPCSALTDTPGILQYAAVAGPGDVLVLISKTGHAPDTVRAAARRSGGATVIAVTDPTSPLAREAALVLPCRPQEDTNVYTPMSSRLAQLALLDAIQVALALALGEPAIAKLRASKQALRRPTTH